MPKSLFWVKRFQRKKNNNLQACLVRPRESALDTAFCLLVCVLHWWTFTVQASFRYDMRLQSSRKVPDMTFLLISTFAWESYKIASKATNLVCRLSVSHLGSQPSSRRVSQSANKTTPHRYIKSVNQKPTFGLSVHPFVTHRLAKLSASIIRHIHQHNAQNSVLAKKTKM